MDVRELDYKQSWVPKNWCFWTVVLEKILESPLDCKEIPPVNPKGNQSWIFIGRTNAEAETPILWPPDAKNWLHGLQHARLPCLSPTPRACTSSWPSRWWCHPTISSSVIPFCFQSFPASGHFPMSQFFASGGQSIGASASLLPMNIQD